MADVTPFRIEPMFVHRIWGARSLAPLFPEKKNLPETIGEVWLTGMDCRVANGAYAGKTLGETWRALPEGWRGREVAQYRDFPLLVKFIFPKDKLSIQVHPDDAYAAKHETDAGGRGKTEMWHVLSAEPGSEILVGLKPDVTKETFRVAVERGNVEELFQRHAVKPGDTYFIPAGTQHAILPGVVIAEVQEYSDLTYRVYDYGRLDAKGKPRELHIEKALAVTKFEGTRGGKTVPLEIPSHGSSERLLAACEFFATERWDFQHATPVDGDAGEFQLLLILSGAGKFDGANFSFDYHAGETWFAPASLLTATLKPSEPTSLLRITVPNLKVLHDRLLGLGVEEAAISKVVVA